MKSTRVFSLVLTSAALCACTLTPVVLGPFPVEPRPQPGTGQPGEAPVAPVATPPATPQPGRTPKPEPTPAARPSADVAPSPTAKPSPVVTPSAQPEAVSAVPRASRQPLLSCFDQYRLRDTSHDGILQPEELETLERFKALDRNRDGRVVAPEFCEYGETSMDSGDTCEAFFHRLDLDQDGLVTLAEVRLLDGRTGGKKDGMGFYYEGYFWKLERDGDDKLSLAESCDNPFKDTNDPCGDRFRVHATSSGSIPWYKLDAMGWSLEESRKYDFNRDRAIDRREWGHAKCGEPAPVELDPCRERFDAYAGTDGTVDVAEAAKLSWDLARFRAADLDANGNLDRSEFCENMRVEGVEPACKERFVALAGADNLIDAGEAASGGITELLAKHDFDDDGRLSAEEYGNAACGDPIP